jgi:predicted Holliday junction resolvase-like endonuclease
MVQKLIQQLLSIPELRVECPRCNEEFPIKRGKLFSMYDSYPPAILKVIRKRFEAAEGLNADLKERKQELAGKKRTQPARIAAGALGANFGKIAEQIIPAFVTFPYKQNECRPLFEPVDYVVFAGLAPKGRVHEIRLVDVKSLNATLSKPQRQIRDRVEEGKIRHKVIGK